MAEDKILVACYDNPNTMMREAHQDGKIIMGMTAYMLAMIPDDFVMPMILNIGPWDSGQIVGDPKAIDKDWGKK